MTTDDKTDCFTPRACALGNNAVIQQKLGMVWQITSTKSVEHEVLLLLHVTYMYIPAPQITITYQHLPSHIPIWWLTSVTATMITSLLPSFLLWSYFTRERERESERATARQFSDLLTKGEARGHWTVEIGVLLEEVRNDHVLRQKCYVITYTLHSELWWRFSRKISWDPQAKMVWLWSAIETITFELEIPWESRRF